MFSGDTFEDQIASLTWPCVLPPGWSVEWDTTPANDDNAESCNVQASSSHLISSFSTRFISAAMNSELLSKFELQVPFGDFELGL